jgi:hypothetical protein
MRNTTRTAASNGNSASITADVVSAGMWLAAVMCCLAVAAGLICGRCKMWPQGSLRVPGFFGQWMTLRSVGFNSVFEMSGDPF